MYKLSKSFRFEAAHKLENYLGKCAKLHGHSFGLTVTVKGDQLDLTNNILIDYCDIKKLVQPIMDQFLDHHYLNETLDCKNPTSEFIAKWIFEYIEYLLLTNYLKQDTNNVKLYSVKINETCTCSCTYRQI
jgi:6-pyruvoyltetrahydropterin/6-carboxytetrahydropterin synthase